MANVLKQSTQIKVRIGPFVDVGDGFTPETGITLGAADEAELLKANGAATVDIAAATWAAVTGADGWYDLTLTTSHTDTIGELVVVVQDDSVCLPVFARFQVVEEEVYDDLYGSGAAGAGRIAGTVSAAVGTATASNVWSDDITEATARHFIGRRMRFTSGALLDQSRPIIGYELDTAEGKFTVVPFTEAPSDNDTFVVEL